MEYQGITWAGIPVEDFEGATAFFRGLLGIRISRVDEEEQAEGLVFEIKSKQPRT